MAPVRKLPDLARGTAPTPPAKGRKAAEQGQAASAVAQVSLPFIETAAEAEQLLAGARGATHSPTDSMLPDPAAPPLSAAATQRLWFCIYLPHLPLEACGSGSSPLAVVEEQQGIHRVLLVNRAAAAAGVQPGQSSNAALALLPELELAERNPLNEDQVLESLAGWLERFSSFVSLPGQNLLLLEIAGSLRLFGGLKSLRQQVSSGLQQHGFTALLAIAPTPLAATWLARSERRACVRDPANLGAQLRNLPLRCLGWPAATREALAGMGIGTVGECLRLPREGFARRFGASRLLDLDRALGRLPDPRISWRAPEPFCADYEMLEEQSDRALLLAVCAELLQSLERFLLVRQLGMQRLEFSFYHLKAAATSLSLGCAQADRSAARWQDLLGIRFERVKLPEPVIAVRLQGGHTQPMQAASGRLRFDEQNKKVECYSMTQLAERLTARIGGQSVIGVTTVAEHRPQYAWAARNLLANKVSDALTCVRRGLRRPLWMLPEPALLSAEDGQPVHLGRLQIVAGPERLETGWWDEDGIARDYYTAINPRGMRLWIFRNRRSQPSAWYLHGFFG